MKIGAENEQNSPNRLEQSAPMPGGGWGKRTDNG
jgi:hypothetical protein